MIFVQACGMALYLLLTTALWKTAWVDPSSPQLHSLPQCVQVQVQKKYFSLTFPFFFLLCHASVYCVVLEYLVVGRRGETLRVCVS